MRHESAEMGVESLRVRFGVGTEESLDTLTQLARETQCHADRRLINAGFDCAQSLTRDSSSVCELKL
jgi:hypothetical protein